MSGDKTFVDRDGADPIGKELKMRNGSKAGEGQKQRGECHDATQYEGAPLVANRDQTSGQRKVVVIQRKRDDCEFNGKQQPHEGQPAEKVKTGNLADSQG